MIAHSTGSWLLYFTAAFCWTGCVTGGQDSAGGSVLTTGNLTGNSWQWKSFSTPEEQFAVSSPAQYRIRFHEDGTVSLKTDCNNAGGSFSVDGDRLTIEIGTSTMALCPAESRSEQFLELLGRASSHSVAQDRLTVQLNGGGEMVFTSAAEGMSGAGESTHAGEQPEEIQTSGLLGRWEWVEFLGMDDSIIKVSEPSRYVLEFRADGISVLVDYNRGMGGFTLSGSSLSFSEIATTRMACPPDSAADQYLNYLNYVRSYVVKDGQLYLSLWADGGIMHFRPAGEGF